MLLDGVDEVKPESRGALKKTIESLYKDYSSDNYIIVSSRPEAAEEGWLKDLGFREASVEPLAQEQKELLIDQWFVTMSIGLAEGDEERRSESIAAAARMKGKLRQTPSLNRLASNPLLCALLCAYQQLGREFIPDKPQELARELSELILERRDRERGIQEENYSPSYRALGFDNKRELTEQIAYFIAENAKSGRSDGLRESIRNIVHRYVERISRIGGDKADEILRGFVERSGMLKETGPGRLGFIHNFFKEYHASAEYVRHQDFPKFARNGHDAVIRPVVIFTAAQDSGTTPMIRALLSLSPNEWSQQPERFQRERDLLALQCGATGRPHDFVEDLVERRAALFPPRGMREARAIAELGDEVVPYLSHAENRKAHAGEQAACIRARRCPAQC